MKQGLFQKNNNTHKKTIFRILFSCSIVIIVSLIVYFNLSIHYASNKSDKSINKQIITSHESESANTNLIITTPENFSTTFSTTLSPSNILPNVTPQIEQKKNQQQLITSLETYTKDYQGVYGIYYWNLVSQEEFGIHDDDEFVAASTIKIPLNLYLFEGIKAGTVNPIETMTYVQEDYEEGTGIIQQEEFGNEYTIRELSRLSIEKSDNIATNMLFRLLGLSNLKAYTRKLGGTMVDDQKNISSPKDMGLYMKKVYDFYKNNSELGNELMSYFLNTEFHDRIDAMLPQNVKVAHKIGTQIGCVHDIGIVFANKPYILSVMSKDVYEDDAKIVIANISKIIYDYVSTAAE